MSKLVDDVAFADVDNEESVDNRLETAQRLLTASQVSKQLDNSSSMFAIFVVKTSGSSLL